MVGAVDIIEKEDFMTDLEKSTHAGRFDIIEWKYDVNINRTVILTADLHDKYAGEYIVKFLELCQLTCQSSSLKKNWIKKQ